SRVTASTPSAAIRACWWQPATSSCPGRTGWSAWPRKGRATASGPTGGRRWKRSSRACGSCPECGPAACVTCRGMRSLLAGYCVARGRRHVAGARIAWYADFVGHVYERVRLSAQHEEDVTMLVDTGATYSLISPSLADRLGLVRFPRKVTVTLAN